MHAFILNAPIGPAGLQLVELPAPTPVAGQVQLRVQAISLNPVDVKTTEGKGIYGRIKDESPLIPGWDVAGTVTAVGPGVQGLAVGDDVFGMISFPGHARAYAEYVVAPAAHLVHKPATIGHAEAAAGTLAPLTAWQGLVTHARVQPGQRVLVHAAAGGVGHYAVQLLKHLGAYVVGTASATKLDFVRSLGADEVIDYQQQPFEQALTAPVDVVFDSLAGDTQLRSLDVLRPGGTLISILGLTPDTPARAQAKGVRAEAMLVDSDLPGMAQIAELLASGALRSHVAATYPFAELPAAIEAVRGGRTQGKVVVTL